MSAEADDTMTAKALDGLTVIDLTRYLPGPYCTRLLADLGADVVKVEAPGGDPVRQVAAWYELLNAGKRVVTIDLRDERGRGELNTLLANARVCVEGFRPSTSRAIGVDAVTLRARHPHLVHCSISGYGQAGEDADRAGHDINYQAAAGILGDPPRVPSLLIADMTAGLHAAIRILAAVVGQGFSPADKKRSGTASVGSAIDISLAAAAFSWTPFVAPPVLSGEYACYNVYETADGKWLVLGALERKFWDRFCAVAGRHEWMEQHVDEAAQARLLHDVRQLLVTRDQTFWLRAFAGVDCCLSPAKQRGPAHGGASQG